MLPNSVATAISTYCLWLRRGTTPTALCWDDCALLDTMSSTVLVLVLPVLTTCLSTMAASLSSLPPTSSCHRSLSLNSHARSSSPASEPFLVSFRPSSSSIDLDQRRYSVNFTTNWRLVDDLGRSSTMASSANDVDVSASFFRWVSAVQHCWCPGVSVHSSTTRRLFSAVPPTDGWRRYHLSVLIGDFLTSRHLLIQSQRQCWSRSSMSSRRLSPSF